MNWICVGLIAGSLVTSLHDTEEACKGREAMLQKQKVRTTCVPMPSHSVSSGIITSYGTVLPNN